MLNVVKRDLKEKEYINEIEKIKTKIFLHNEENKKK
jgi:hypothetical protein